MEESGKNFFVGIVCCIISSLFFGSQFVPVKPFKTHDGFFIQWVMGCAIFVVGLIVNISEGFPKFYPLAMLGGALWATGNVTAIPIVNTIGMSLGILIWCSTNLLFGWASGRFGWFNTNPQIPASDTLNYIGMIFALISTVMFFFVKPFEQKKKCERHEMNDDKEALLSDDSVEEDGDSHQTNPQTPSVTQLTSTNRGVASLFGNGRHTIAVIVSLLAGIFYGLNFAPVIYIQDNYPNASKRGLPYVFAHYCGAFAACTFYFICYCAYQRNKPKINPRVTLGAFIMGILWAVAQTAWFVANENLSEAISFPIITRFPGIVASLWGVLYFKEIRGRRNLQVLFWAIIITLIGGILSGLSKIVKI